MSASRTATIYADDDLQTTSARERDRLRLARQLQTAPLVALMRRAPVPKMTHKPYASWWILQVDYLS